MRLLWWREALEDLPKDKVKKHPIIQALGPHIQTRELDPELLILMIENRFGEFFKPAANFTGFIEARRRFLQPYYMNTCLALGAEDSPENLAAFLAFDVIGCLQNLDFYRAREITPFNGKIKTSAIDELLKFDAKSSSAYFRGLGALARWHYKRLARVDFMPQKIKTAPQHPGKIFALWRS